MVKLTKLLDLGGRYTFSEVSVNPEKVSVIEGAHAVGALLREDASKFPDGLDPNVRFTNIVVEGNTYTVVGDHETISKKLRNDRRLLNG